MIFCLDPCNVLFSMELATEPLSLCFLMIGVYSFLRLDQECGSKKTKLYWAALGGVALAVSNNIRPNAIVFLLSALLYFMLRFRKKQFCVIAVFLVVFSLATAGLKTIQNDTLGVKLGINYGWTLFEGMDNTASGGWTAENAAVITEVMFSNPPEQLQGIMLEKALDRVKDYDTRTWLRLFADKGVNIWTKTDYAYSSDELSAFRVSWDGLINFLHLIGLGIFSILAIYTSGRHWRNKIDPRMIVLYFPVVGMIIAHSFATSIPRYQYLAVPFLLAASVSLCETVYRQKRASLIPGK